MFPTVQNNITDLATALKQSKVDTQSPGNKGFLKFDFKTGDWAFGRDATPVEGDKVIVNTYTIQHGWILWSGGSATKEMKSFTQEKPPAMPSQGEDHPSEARSFECRFMNEDSIVAFETSSYGGRKACDALLGEILKKVGEGETEYLFPVAVLSTDEGYKSKKGGYIFNPVFKVVSWVNVDGVANDGTKAIEEATATEEVEETPTRRRRKV